MEVRSMIKSMVSGMCLVCLGLEKTSWQEVDLEHDVEKCEFYPEFRMDSYKFLSGLEMN